MGKFYSVKIGRIPGIYLSWSECEKQVKGFSEAEYKSFSSKKEAENFLRDNNFPNLDIPSPKNIPIEKIIQNDDGSYKKYDEKEIEKINKKYDEIEKINKKYDEIEIFTDGSHKKHEDEGHIGFGGFILYNGKEYYFSQTCDSFIIEKYKLETPFSNCVMEFLAFAEVLYMISESKKDFTSHKFIFKIDYEGVRNWMAGTWETKNVNIKNIKKECDIYLKKISYDISIEHIKGHSNNYGNEKADQMAKSEKNLNTFSELF